MRYRNPRIAEPTVRPSEGRDFLLLLAGVAGLVVVLVAVAMFALEAMATWVPFSVERRLAESVIVPGLGDKRRDPREVAAEQALRSLVDRVAAAMHLPGDMKLTVHYSPAATVNAMATLGGQMFVYRGLIEKLKSEDALAAVLAHEIGHVRARHVVRAMGRGVALVGVLGMVGIKSQGLNRWALNKGGELTALSYSRDAEREADRAALDAIYALYGNVGGVLEIFDLFKTLEGGGAEILRTHPLAEHRRSELERVATSEGMPTSGTLRPMPEALLALSGKPELRSGSASESVPGVDRSSATR